MCIRDKSLYSLLTITILIYCFFLGFLGLDFIPFYRGLGLPYSFRDTTGTSLVFHLFIIFICFIIMLIYFYFGMVRVSIYLSVSKFFFHKYTFYSKKIINKMAEQLKTEYPLLQSVFYLLDDKKSCKVKTSYVVPNEQYLYLFAYLVFTISIAPLFYFNLYVLSLMQGIRLTVGTSLMDISLSMCLISGFLSCSGFYLLFVVGLNLYYSYSNKLWIMLIKRFKELCFYIWKTTPLFKTKYILFISLLIYIGINILALNIIIYCLDLSTNSLLLYMYVRLNMLPFMIYINNILISKFFNYFTLASHNKSEINYSIFSRNMVNSITLTRLFVLIGFISLFAFLPININDFVLKMNNPSSGGNHGWNPVPDGNSGPSGNIGPEGNPGGNPGPGGFYGESTGLGANPGTSWDTIKIKIAARADNIAHRQISIYSTLNNNNDLTRDEIVLLADKIRANGLENSRPFALLEWKKGEYKGLFRAVQLLKGAQHPTTTNTMPVKATGEFTRFLDLLD